MSPEVAGAVASGAPPDAPGEALRILFLSTSGQLGGAERSLFDVVASVRQARPEWPVHLLVPAEGPLANAARGIGVSVEVLEFPPRLARLGDSPVRGGGGARRLRLLAELAAAVPAAAVYLRRLRRLVARIQPAVVHTNGFKMHALAAWALPRSSALVWHMHDYVSSRPVMAKILRALAARPAAVVANSTSVAEDVRQVCGPDVRVLTVYNAVDLERFRPDGPRADLDALSGLPPAAPGTVRVGLVATYARWKGHDVFLRALAALPRELPVRGYVVGDALYQTDGSQLSRAELSARASALGLQGRVGFPGFVADAAQAMRALDVVVHASTQPEPFGLVIAEAMACERAVIVSAAGGALEVIAGVPDAPTHPPDDSDALAARIESLVRDAGRRQTLAEHGRSSARKRFGRPRLAAELVPIYQDAARTR